VVGEGEPPEREDHLIAPARAVRGCRIQHDEHEGPDAVNTGSLSVEVNVEAGGVGSLRGHLGGGGSVAAEEDALHDRHLRGQGSAYDALVFLGDGRGTLALLRGDHDSLDGGEDRN
jgi:hypothetical protein